MHREIITKPQQTVTLGQSKYFQLLFTNTKAAARWLVVCRASLLAPCRGGLVHQARRGSSGSHTCHIGWWKECGPSNRPARGGGLSASPRDEFFLKNYIIKWRCSFSIRFVLQHIVLTAQILLEPFQIQILKNFSMFNVPLNTRWQHFM